MSDILQVKVEKREGYAVISTDGYINNAGGEEIARQANALLDTGQRRLLLDLARTKIVNSIGISILIEVLERTLELEGRLAFCNLTPTIEKTFRIMGLARYATIHASEAEARESLLGPAVPGPGGNA
jgi:anti-anti-sigma factor